MQNARVLHVAFIAAIVLYAGILVFLETNDLNPAVFAGDPLLNNMVGILAVVAIVTVGLGTLISRMTLKAHKADAAIGPSLFSAHLLCAAAYEAVAIYGLILGILGADWGVTVPFFVVALGLMVLTFPTEERWRVMAGKQ